MLELQLSLLILGVGLVMVAGAFPVGLHFFNDTVERTIAGMLARSTLARLRAPRTSQYAGAADPAEPILTAAGQLAVIECFAEVEPGLCWLFDTSEGRHSGAAGRCGELLTAQGLGADIDAWLPAVERISPIDGRFGCQVFYQRIADPLGGAALTYQVLIAVQKSPLQDVAAAGWAGRFEPPSRPRTVWVQGRQVAWPAEAASVRPGALLLDVSTGDGYRVVEVSEGALHLSRPAEAMDGHRVRAVNDCVAVYRGIVSKEAIR